MKNIAIPRFDPASPLHASLAELSAQAHAAVKRGEETTAFDNRIDDKVEELWNTKR